MSKHQTRQLIEARVDEDGLVETGVTGVQLFRLTEPVCCAPEFKRLHGESPKQWSRTNQPDPAGLI